MKNFVILLILFCFAAPLAAQEDAGGGQKSTEIVTISVTIPKDVDEVHIKRNDDGEWVVDQPTAGEKIFETAFIVLIFAITGLVMKRLFDKADRAHHEELEYLEYLSSAKDKSYSR